MKKSLLITVFFCVILIMNWNSGSIFAQKANITVPDYSYGIIYSEYGVANHDGVTDPGPYGGFSSGENERQSGIFLANGFRWWDEPVVCGLEFHPFNFPGDHGNRQNSVGNACMNPPTGWKASWGSIIADPASRKIWSLTGAGNMHCPTKQYCVQFGLSQICYPILPEWGTGTSYGYLRRVVTVKSSGTLKPGDPVSVMVSMTNQISHEGAGTASSMGVLFLNKLSEVPWFGWFGREYLKWGDVQDLMYSSLINNMLAVLMSTGNNTEDSITTVTIGDTIIMELMFNNSIKIYHSPEGAVSEGWAGKKPLNIFTDVKYSRTDTIKGLIKRKGNMLAYNLECLTQGAVLEPVTSDGPNVDEDNDGIIDSQEKGKNGNDSQFDGNADGTPDFNQANVASFHTYDGNNYVTVVVPVGIELSQMKVTDNPSPSDTPADAQFPWGFFDFSIDGLDEGEAVNVTMILHDPVTVTKYYKYGITPDNTTRHWYEFSFNGNTGAEINGNVITLHFMDGRRGDDDLTYNGSIKEPGGPAIAGTTGIQELSETAGITVYPNPAYDYITLKLNGIISSNAHILRIHAITGKILQERIINVCDVNEEFIIPTDNLPYGLYLITLSAGNHVYKTKFIKLK